MLQRTMKHVFYFLYFVRTVVLLLSQLKKRVFLYHSATRHVH
jgi:hypothetical protein